MDFSLEGLGKSGVDHTGQRAKLSRNRRDADRRRAHHAAAGGRTGFAIDTPRPRCYNRRSPRAGSPRRPSNRSQRAVPTPQSGIPGRKTRPTQRGTPFDRAVPAGPQSEGEGVTPSRERVHVVVERADGSRIVRVPAPRWLVSVAVGLAGLVLVAAGALYRDYVTLTAHRADFGALQARVREQQVLIDGFQDRVAQMRAEVDGWRQLRARIWQPFGPESDPAAPRPAGVGGTAIRHIEPPPSAPLPLLDELEQVSAVVAEEGESLRALERFIAKAGRVLTSLPSRWPVRGPVNSDFGPRLSPWSEGSGEHHSGLDIGAARGTPVVAPAPGTVVFSGPNAEYGIALVIDHGHDIKTLYGHLTRVEVALGEKIERGQIVALTGNTGRSSGPHLHYEIQVAGKAVNPRLYLWD